MPAYLIVDIAIHDRLAMREYEDNALPLFGKAGGRPIAFDESPTPIEGLWNNRLVIFEFPDKESIARLMASPEYAPWRAHRLASSDGRSVAVEGI